VHHGLSSSWPSCLGRLGLGWQVSCRIGELPHGAAGGCDGRFPVNWCWGGWGMGREGCRLLGAPMGGVGVGKTHWMRRSIAMSFGGSGTPTMVRTVGPRQRHGPQRGAAGPRGSHRGGGVTGGGRGPTFDGEHLRGEEAVDLGLLRVALGIASRKGTPRRLDEAELHSVATSCA
jgi:hypothetical protein